MVVGKIVGMLILWVGVAMYPLVDDDDVPRTWHKFLQNLLDSTPIMIGALLMTCLERGRIKMTVYLLWEHDGNEVNLFGVYRLKDKAVAWQEYLEISAIEEGLHWLQYSVTEAQVRE